MVKKICLDFSISQKVLRYVGFNHSLLNEGSFAIALQHR